MRFKSKTDDKAKKSVKATAVTPGSVISSIRKKLGHVSTDRPASKFLDLGDEKLNGVLGDPEKGLFYGQIVEISGKPSQGKTALAIDIAAAAQAQGSFVHWVDLERSFNAPWAERRGLKAEQVELYIPYVGKFGTDKVKRLITAEELFTEVEEGINTVHNQFPDATQIVIVDSVTGMLVEGEQLAGLDKHNMKTSNALPVFLGRLLRRWVALVGETCSIAIFLNQLRTKPGLVFGDPDYTTGGNALPFYAHSRVRMRRVKGGRIQSKGKTIGIKGVIRNDKNKAGGSEGEEIGFKILFNGASKFLTAHEVKEEDA